MTVSPNIFSLILIFTQTIPTGLGTLKMARLQVAGIIINSCVLDVQVNMPTLCSQNGATHVKTANSSEGFFPEVQT